MKGFCGIRALVGLALIATYLLVVPAAAQAAAWNRGGLTGGAWDGGWAWLSSLWDGVWSWTQGGGHGARAGVAAVAKDGSSDPSSGSDPAQPTGDSGPALNPDGTPKH
jgi:hypothetical protein